MDKHKKIVSLKEAIVTGLILDCILLGIASTVMDGGRLFRFALFIAGGCWVCNGLILIFKQFRCSKFGRDFIRFGYLIIIAILILIGGILFAF